MSIGSGGPQRAPSARLTIKADTLSVRRVTTWLTRLLDRTGAGALQTRVELAVHEVCMNIIDHSYGPGHVTRGDDIIIEAAVDDGAVLIWLWDRGSSFDFSAVARPIPGVPQIRGYGLVIVEQLVSELGYVREHNTNIWSLRFDRASNRQETL